VVRISVDESKMTIMTKCYNCNNNTILL
jgi:hypothetical protein